MGAKEEMERERRGDGRERERGEEREKEGLWHTASSCREATDVEQR